MNEPNRENQPMATDEWETNSYVRMGIHFRLQHILMFTSFIILVLTGIPLKYATVGMSRIFMNLWGGLEMAGTVHRVAGVVMILTAIYHAVYLLVTFFRFELSLEMLPTPKDFKDLYGMLRFFFALTDERPKFGRFAYWEKFDYWAVFWGIAIMVGSGLILWFPVTTVKYLPVWMLGIAKVAHSDEALLAALAIFMWHFYNVHLRPDVFPMNWVWITGRISQKEMREWHPLEYEHLLKSKQEDPSPRLQTQKPSDTTRQMDDDGEHPSS
jgi:formate dehydrogenase subunit gamma